MVHWADHFKNWERARPIYPKNHIISSDWGPKGKLCHFHPSYNCEPSKDIKRLVTMEYARIWAIEKERWNGRHVIIDKNKERQKAWQKKFEEENRRRIQRMKEKPAKKEETTAVSKKFVVAKHPRPSPRQK